MKRFTLIALALAALFLLAGPAPAHHFGGRAFFVTGRPGFYGYHGGAAFRAFPAYGAGLYYAPPVQRLIVLPPAVQQLYYAPPPVQQIIVQPPAQQLIITQPQAAAPQTAAPPAVAQQTYDPPAQAQQAPAPGLAYAAPSAGYAAGALAVTAAPAYGGGGLLALTGYNYGLHARRLGFAFDRFGRPLAVRGAAFTFPGRRAAFVATRPAFRPAFRARGVAVRAPFVNVNVGRAAFFRRPPVVVRAPGVNVRVGGPARFRAFGRFR